MERANGEKRVLVSFHQLLRNFIPSSRHLHDPYILLCLRHALIAAREGNYGIGAVLVDEGGSIVAAARNRTFVPYFRSDRHAEMEVLTRFENRTRGTITPAQYTLFCSLEPCPMCITRILIAGVGKIRYAIASGTGGMARRADELPWTWQKYAEGKIIEEADCSEALRRIAFEIFQWNAERNFRRVLERGTA
jgi:tRNA(adenine34) deaminase